MALGGATIGARVSATGHSTASATTILHHDLTRHPEMADAALKKGIARDGSEEGTGRVQ